MPEYSFECEKCVHKFTVVMSLKDYVSQQKCPKCKSAKTYRDFAADNVLTKDSEPRTLGMLAEKNAREKGLQ